MQSTHRNTCKFDAPVLGIALVLVAACSGSPQSGIDESTAGQVIGGIAGAAAGSTIGEGSGRTVATVAGALIGSIAGERIGANMEQRDMQRTAEALEYNERAETTGWVNPNTDTEFAVTPIDTYRQSGQPCREFEFRVETELGRDTQQRTACRRNDGTWEVID